MLAVGIGGILSGLVGDEEEPADEQQTSRAPPAGPARGTPSTTPPPHVEVQPEDKAPSDPQAATSFQQPATSQHAPRPAAAPTKPPARTYDLPRSTSAPLTSSAGQGRTRGASHSHPCPPGIPEPAFRCRWHNFVLLVGMPGVRALFPDVMEAAKESTKPVAVRGFKTVADFLLSDASQRQCNNIGPANQHANSGEGDAAATSASPAVSQAPGDTGPAGVQDGPRVYEYLDVQLRVSTSGRLTRLTPLMKDLRYPAEGHVWLFRDGAGRVTLVPCDAPAAEPQVQQGQGQEQQQGQGQEQQQGQGQEQQQGQGQEQQQGQGQGQGQGQDGEQEVPRDRVGSSPPGPLQASPRQQGVTAGPSGEAAGPAAGNSGGRVTAVTTATTTAATTAAAAAAASPGGGGGGALGGASAPAGATAGAGGPPAAGAGGPASSLGPFPVQYALHRLTLSKASLRGLFPDLQPSDWGQEGRPVEVTRVAGQGPDGAPALCRYPNATLKVTGQRWTLIRCRALLRDLGITDRGTLHMVRRPDGRLEVTSVTLEGGAAAAAAAAAAAPAATSTAAGGSGGGEGAMGTGGGSGHATEAEAGAEGCRGDADGQPHVKAEQLAEQGTGPAVGNRKVLEQDAVTAVGDVGAEAEQGGGYDHGGGDGDSDMEADGSEDEGAYETASEDVELDMGEQGQDQDAEGDEGSGGATDGEEGGEGGGEGEAQAELEGPDGAGGEMEVEVEGGSSGLGSQGQGGVVQRGQGEVWHSPVGALGPVTQQGGLPAAEGQAQEAATGGDGAGAGVTAGHGSTPVGAGAAGAAGAGAAGGPLPPAEGSNEGGAVAFEGEQGQAAGATGSSHPGRLPPAASNPAPAPPPLAPRHSASLPTRLPPPHTGGAAASLGSPTAPTPPPGALPPYHSVMLLGAVRENAFRFDTRRSGPWRAHLESRLGGAEVVDVAVLGAPDDLPFVAKLRCKRAAAGQGGAEVKQEPEEEAEEQGQGASVQGVEEKQVKGLQSYGLRLTGRGLKAWFARERVAVGDTVEVQLCPDGRYRMGVVQRVGEAGGRQGVPQQAVERAGAGGEAAAVAAEAGGAGAAGAEPGGPWVTLAITETALGLGCVDVRKEVLQALFALHVKHHGLEVNIPVTLFDESDGLSYDLSLRGKAKRNAWIMWRLRPLRALFQKHRADSNCLLHLRLSPQSAAAAAAAAEDPDAAAAAAATPCLVHVRVSRLPAAAVATAAASGDAAATAPAAVQQAAAGGADGRPAKRQRLAARSQSTAASVPSTAVEAVTAPGGADIATSPASLPLRHSTGGGGAAADELRPAAAIAHLHGCVPPSVGLPPPQRGELRFCGLTFPPSLAPAVRAATLDWLQSQQCHLSDIQPAGGQITMQVPPAAPAGSGTGGEEAWVEAFHRCNLSSNVISAGVARYLGLTDERGWDAALPEGHLELSRRLVQPCGDAERGGCGLRACSRIKPSSVLGVVGGFVMTREEAGRFVGVGFRSCGPGLRRELAARAGASEVSTVWRLLAGSFRMPYPGLRLAAQGAAGGSPLDLIMLGYGNLGALVNDPRVNPRAWQPGNDVDGPRSGTNLTSAAAAANVLVVPVCVRGLVLPVLVALRDIGPGEQLLRDYGADWWRGIGDAWEVLEFDGGSMQQVLHPAEPEAAEGEEEEEEEEEDGDNEEEEGEGEEEEQEEAEAAAEEEDEEQEEGVVGVDGATGGKQGEDGNAVQGQAEGGDPMEDERLTDYY